MLQIQTGQSADTVIQSVLTQLHKGWGATCVALYRGEQVLMSVGESIGAVPLPSTWRTEKISQKLGETWLFPLMVRQTGWGWLLTHWQTQPQPEIVQEIEIVTLHLGLVIQAAEWDKNYPFSLPNLEDEPYYFLLNNLPLGVCLSDVEGNCIYANETLAKTWQIPINELLGRGWLKAIHPDDRKYVIQRWEQFVQNPKINGSIEYRIKHPDGSILFSKSHTITLQNDAGDVVGFLCAHEDITQARILELMLRESEQKYRQIVDYQTDFLVYSLPDTTITFANPSLCEALGYSEDELIGLRWEAVVLHPQDLTVLCEEIQHLTPQNPIFRYTNQIRVKQGQIIYVEWINLGIFNETSHLVAIQSIGRDITALRQAEQELRESREQFATLLQNMPGMVYRYYPETATHPHRFAYVSDYAQEIFELKPAEIMANATANWINFTHPEDLPRLLSSIQEAVTQSASWHCEWRIITPSGKLKWLEGRSQMRQNCDEPFWDGIIFDITELKLAKLELEKQQQFLQEIIVATKAIIYIYDLEENRNVFVNLEIQLVLGYTVEEIQAMGDQVLPTLVHPDDWPVVQKNLVRLSDPDFTGDTTTEYRMRTKSGEWRWLLSRDRVLNRNEQGLAKQTLGVATDITELKITQQSLAENQQFLQHILNILSNLPVTVWRYQLWPDGREAFLYISSGCRDLFGVPAEEAMENVQVLWNLTIPEDLFKIKESTRLSQENLTVWQADFRIITPQGEQKWIRGQGKPQRQPDGSTIWDSAFVDITSQKQAEQQLQEFNYRLETRVQERTLQLQRQAQEEGLLRIIIETIHESVDITKTLPVVLTETRQTLGCDRVVVYQFNSDWSGFFLAESVGDGWIPVITEPMKTLSDHCLEETQGGRFQQHYILVSNDIYTSGFTQCHIELLESFQARAQVIVPIFLEQKLWGLLAAYQNSGPRIWQTNEIEVLQHVGLHLAIALRQAELYEAAQNQVVELEKLNRMKDEFLSTVSHELRSPMHNISLALKMLELRLKKAGIAADPELGIERYLHVLKTSTKQETDLINDLLDLARLNVEKSDVKLEIVNIQEILDKLLPAIEERTQAQNQQLILQLPEPLFDLYSNTHFLQRILQELLHNACKYTPSGETITLVIEKPANEHCLFRVINTGVTIPPEEQERVFDNFYRIATHDPWQHGGTGLGLALVKKMVNRLGGEIHLMSGNNITEFSVVLPTGNPA